jgi:rSAM/selenodomain-associated transferase 1
LLRLHGGLRLVLRRVLDLKAAPMEERLRNRLVIFTRYPEPGKVKTRLIPAIGARRAADLQRRMTERTLATASRLDPDARVAVEVHHDGGDRERMTRVFGAGWTYLPQQYGADLGQRLQAAFHRCFEDGADKVVVVGTDCPGLSVPLIQRAFEGLDRAPVVLGPARDGGYYLIGLTRPQPRLFEEIPWGTPQVFTETANRARELSLSPALLTPLDDVDRPEDLAVWEAALSQDRG